MFSTDVTQAYLQSAEALQSKIFLTPCKAFQLESDKILKFLNPVYALSESGDYWGRAFSKHLLKDTGMQSCVYDPELFYKHLLQDLIEICDTYVDDTLHVSTK